MSESGDVDTAVQRVRDAFDEAVDEAEELRDQARESVETRSTISNSGSNPSVVRSNQPPVK
ncbi:hypothetical protein ACFQJD_01500 [Haloplanus sp. GCM10025708]|uniref:hypothetical protein n=1 Tax=Haloferacaceae TaxID=1644056 RepID=UPI00361E907B